MVTDKSGYAGIARWLIETVPLLKQGMKEEVTKRHPGIKHIALWVEEQYEHGRTTAISTDELMVHARRYLPGLFESELDKFKDEVKNIAMAISEDVAGAEELANLDPDEMDEYLEDVVRREGTIQLLAVTNLDGKRIRQIYAHHGEKALFSNLLSNGLNVFQTQIWIG